MRASTKSRRSARRPCSVPCTAVYVTVTPSGAVIAADEYGAAYRSSDRGLNWTLGSGGVPSLQAPLDIAAGTNGTLYAVGSSVLFTSSDDGASWQSIIDMGSWLQVEALPANELLLSHSTSGLWRRSAGGSYSQAGLGQIPETIRRLYHATDGRWLAATDAGIYRAEASLAAWTLVGPGIAGVAAFLPQPGGGALAAGPRGAARSDAQLQNWQEDMNGMRSALLSDVVAAGSSLFAAAFGGEVFRSDDGAASWVRRQAGLPVCTLAALARLDNGRLLASCSRSPNATFTSMDNASSWAQLATLPYVDTIVSANSTVAVALKNYTGLWRSTDGGASWTRSSQSFDTESPIQLVRASDGALWVRSSAALYRSTDLGASWQPAHTGLATPGTQSLWPVADGLLSLGQSQAYRYSGGGWSAFGSPYSTAPSSAVQVGAQILLTGGSVQLLGDAASGNWRRIASASPYLGGFARTSDGSLFAVARFAASPIWKLSDDRIFADTLDRP